MFFIFLFQILLFLQRLQKFFPTHWKKFWSAFQKKLVRCHLKSGGKIQMAVKGRGKTSFLCKFLKKKLVYCLDVVIILYLCIRKKFSKTGNFWKSQNEKVSRFDTLLEKREKQNQLKYSELEMWWWRNCWTKKNKKLSKSEKRVWESGEERGETDFTGLGKMDKQSFATFIHILLL